MPTGLSGVTAIATGDYFTVALKSDGTMVAWGRNSLGQTDVPAGLSGVTAIAVGAEHIVALKSDGTVVAWAVANQEQQEWEEEQGEVDEREHRLFQVEAQTTVPAGLSSVTAIAAGGICTVALKSDGTVVAWGREIEDDAATVPAGLSGVTAIAAGNYFTMALKSDGTVVAWGYNASGQTTVPAGLSGVTAIAAHCANAVALKSDGTVVAWGSNQDGETKVPAGLSGVTAIAAGGAYTIVTTEWRVITEPASDLALQFFKLGCALIAAAGVKLSSREQLWLDAHLGAGASAELLSLITSLGPDGLQSELQTLASRLTPEDKHWLHCRAWQLEDLAGSDGTEAEESDAMAFVLAACGWYQLEKPLRAYLLRG